MATKSPTRKAERLQPNPPHRVTSIGRSVNTKPKNKNARRNFKPYRGQG